MTHVILTNDGYKRLQNRLQVKLAEYAQVRAQSQAAFELSGDGWHDNPEFNRAQQMEANLNREIKALTDLLAQGRVVEVTRGARPVDQVRVGSRVSIVRWTAEGPSPTETWEIGGFDDSLPSQGVVAYNAPLGAALYGLREGDYIEQVQIGTQLLDIEVLELHPI